MKPTLLTCSHVLLAVFAVLTGILFSQNQESSGGPLPPVDLRCEYMKTPAGIDVEKARFSWALRHGERGQMQYAYQIIVSTEKNAENGDIWDSGKEISEQSAQVEFKGGSLESNHTYY